MTSLYPRSDLSSNSLSSLLQSVLSDLEINNLAHDTKLVVRSRLFDPAVFIYTVIGILNRDKEFTLRNIHYEYTCNMLKKGKESLSWEPFYDFLDKKQMPVFLKSLCDRLNEISIKEVLSDTKELVDALRLKLPNLTDILIQDGSEIACNCREYKGKFEDANEAKLHRTLSLSSFTELCSSITSGVASERKEISLYKLENRLLLADAGYPSKKLFPKIALAKGYYLIKLKSGSALEVVSYNQYNADGTVTEFKNVKTRFNTYYKIKDKFFNQKCTFDFEVLTAEGSIQRIVAVYNEALDKHVYFATNIPKDTLDAIQIGELYRARWQVEISFRILKGFCSLKKCNTRKSGIVQALIYLSQIVYLLKLIIGQQLQKAADTTFSPKKLVNRIKCHFMDIIELALDSAERLKSYIERHLELFKTYTKSAPSFTNRMRGKSIRHIIEVVSKTPRMPKNA